MLTCYLFFFFFLKKYENQINGTSHSCFKLKISKNQAAHVVCSQLPLLTPDTSYHSLVTKLGGGKPRYFHRLVRVHPTK